ncbi:MAG: prefoldin subunit alpha [Candidatus Hadarchaeales archaeon]
MAEAKKEEEMLGQMEIYRGLYNSLRRRIDILSSALAELSMCTESLKTLKEVKQGTEMLVPMGGEAFIKARLDSNEKVIVGLGADVFVEKTTDEAIATLSERSGAIEKAINEALARLRKIEANIGALEQAILEEGPKE